MRMAPQLKHLFATRTSSTALRLLASAFSSAVFSLHAATPASSPGVSEEKIVFIRHGEKPAGGLGQLDCQGLNRALALPRVLMAKFGKPDFVFASDPHDQKNDSGKPYNYVRPLLTIGPTAIQAGLPVNVSIGYEDIKGLQQELAKPAYRNAVVFVAWEHTLLEQVVKAILVQPDGVQAPIVEADKASQTPVPHWKGSDFDSIYVVTVRRDGAQTRASFTLDHQQLDGQSAACPLPAARP